MDDRWHRPWLMRLLPDRRIEQFLSEGEHVLRDTRPSFKVWFLGVFDVIAAGVLMLAVVVAAADVAVTKMALVLWAVLAVHLVVEFVRFAFTRYVVTDHRAISWSGVYHDRFEWISWRKVTDVSVHSSLGERLLKTATIRVHSANEATGFKTMKGVPNPLEYAQLIADLVNASQGPVTLRPDGAQPSLRD